MTRTLLVVVPKPVWISSRQQRCPRWRAALVTVKLWNFRAITNHAVEGRGSCLVITVAHIVHTQIINHHVHDRDWVQAQTVGPCLPAQRRKELENESQPRP